MATIDYTKEPLEIMEGTILDSLPNDATKETIRIQFIGQQKVMNWKEYAEVVRKTEKKRAKAKLVKQLENMPTVENDDRKTDVVDTSADEVADGSADN